MKFFILMFAFQTVAAFAEIEITVVDGRCPGNLVPDSSAEFCIPGPPAQAIVPPPATTARRPLGSMATPAPRSPASAPEQAPPIDQSLEVGEAERAERPTGEQVELIRNSRNTAAPVSIVPAQAAPVAAAVVAPVAAVEPASPQEAPPAIDQELTNGNAQRAVEQGNASAEEIATAAADNANRAAALAESNLQAAQSAVTAGNATEAQLALVAADSIRQIELNNAAIAAVEAGTATPDQIARANAVAAEASDEGGPDEGAVVEPPAQTPPLPERAVAADNSTEQTERTGVRDYKPESCVWAEDMPRRLVHSPGCSRSSRSQSCVGYVICEQKSSSAKFIRMSSCRADLCGEGDAVDCTKDQSTFSTQPQDETKQFMSKRVRDLIQTPSQATEQ